MQNKPLWERIKAHPLNAQSGSAPYTVKLAQREGWSADFTLRVVEEYRRFLYLTQISKAPVTPPEMVDRAWHMHLTFTRDYWDVLCKDVLGKPLHHDPCEGAEDMPRYHAQFRETRALYADEFGETPPDDIWSKGPVMYEIWYGNGAAAVGLGLTLLAILQDWPNWVTWLGLLLLFCGTLFAIAYMPDNGKRRHGQGGAAGVGGCSSGKDKGGAGCGSGCGGGGGCGG